MEAAQEKGKLFKREDGFRLGKYSSALARTATVVENKRFIRELDRLREHMQEEAVLEHRVVGSSVAMSTGLSIGYVVWLVRGGVLMSSVLSSLPAWRMIDPLPVIANLEVGRKREEDQESLESLIKKGAEAVKAK